MNVSQFEMGEGDQTQRARGRSRVYILPQASMNGGSGEANRPRTPIINLPVIDFEMQRRLGTLPAWPVDSGERFWGVVDPPPSTPREVTTSQLGVFGVREVVEVDYPLVGEFHD